MSDQENGAAPAAGAPSPLAGVGVVVIVAIAIIGWAVIGGRLFQDVSLFGGFLIWAVLSFRAARQRDRAALEAGDVAESPPTSAAATAGAVLVGTAAWAAFIMVVHVWLIGVAPIAAMAA